MFISDELLVDLKENDDSNQMVEELEIDFVQGNISKSLEGG